MHKEKIAHQAARYLGLVIMMQLMFVAFQGVQVSSTGLDFAVATARADLSGTDITGGIGAGDPFQKAGTKAQSMITSLTNIAVPILALAIVCLAIAMFTGRMEPKRAITMMAGGFIVGSAMAIAQWVIK